ncbi:hypothetical protein SAMN05421847_2602 [Halpernia humi]|uniref:Uncharacterized protein n=1 Tax=Halpernia humi TaxID=493375 RepID=A0A1H6AZ78_9FLAO|nr:hypothetical protein [Halpernia humi]SEG53630.1 hypothetical protein SAMN05421847_2602 [Halpernia humi]
MQFLKNNSDLVFKIVIIIALISGWLYSNSLEKKDNKELFDSSFKAVVFKKYNLRNEILLCKDLKIKNKENFINSTSELYNKITVGDTIYKLPNSNYCIILNKNLKVLCYDIDFK